MEALRARPARAVRQAAGAEVRAGGRDRGARPQQGLFVGVEYHKRFDRRSLMAKRHYAPGPLRRVRDGRGEADRALLLPPLQLPELVHLRQDRPVRLRRLPLRGPGVLHHRACGRWRSPSPACRGDSPTATKAICGPTAACATRTSALLSVTDGLGYPDDGAGSNDQGLLMYCEGRDARGMIQHDDQDRGVRYSYLEGDRLRRLEVQLRQPRLLPARALGGAGLQAGRLRLRLGGRQPRDDEPHRERRRPSSPRAAGPRPAAHR